MAAPRSRVRAPIWLPVRIIDQRSIVEASGHAVACETRELHPLTAKEAPATSSVCTSVRQKASMWSPHHSTKAAVTIEPTWHA